MNLSYLIIDDEPIAHDIIMTYSAELEYLKLKKQCYTALEAINYLQKSSVDFIFLDIEMPRLKGLDFLKTLQNPPEVIITTAYQEYALEGYELNVVDYLLKPFSLERFLKAIGKLRASSIKSDKIETNSVVSKTLFVKGNKKLHQFILDDILFVESIAGLVKIHCESQIITASESLSFFETALPKNNFIRVHKSFIVAFNKINSIEGNIAHISEHKIPLGRAYKMNLKGLI
ncbi:response regulator [uncultured Croceitalea sp.]|uniref:LytR/AlgR family response regulator transcription factor n=1 Tax=uncultured Croceitalea sp. TaxID=1798908 RepID=UPI0033059A82